MNAKAKRVTALAALSILAAWGIALAYWYAAEWDIARSNQLLNGILGGRIGGAAAASAAAVAQAVSERAVQTVPGDDRAVLALATAQTIRGQGSKARVLLEKTTALSGRPELVLALGRARAATGDDAGARLAFLRAAWISPNAIATLPGSVRNELLARTEAMQDDLARGLVVTVPSLGSTQQASQSSRSDH